MRCPGTGVHYLVRLPISPKLMSANLPCRRHACESPFYVYNQLNAHSS